MGDNEWSAERRAEWHKRQSMALDAAWADAHRQVALGAPPGVALSQARAKCATIASQIPPWVLSLSQCVQVYAAEPLKAGDPVIIRNGHAFRAGSKDAP